MLLAALMTMTLLMLVAPDGVALLLLRIWVAMVNTLLAFILYRYIMINLSDCSAKRDENKRRDIVKAPIG